MTRSTSFSPSVASHRRQQSFRSAPRRSSHSTAVSTQEVLPVDQDEGRDLFPAWAQSFVNRVLELSRRPEGWDSYGARALKLSAVNQTVEFLSSAAHAIQSDPATSLTTEGGLFLSWNNSAGTLEVVIEPDADVYVTYEDALRGTEWEGLASEAPLLEKWLWRTSSPASG